MEIHYNSLQIPIQSVFCTAAQKLIVTFFRAFHCVHKFHKGFWKHCDGLVNPLGAFCLCAARARRARSMEWRSIKSVLDVARYRRTLPTSWTGRYHTPPPPPKPKPPPTNVPSNRSAERHEALPKDARTSAETSATDHSRCSEVTMIWKEIRTKRGLRRPSETKQGQRAMISLSDAVVCSGNPRAGGS